MERIAITEFGLYPNSENYPPDLVNRLPTEEHVSICLKWLSEHTIRFGRWSLYTSYGYKHMVEKWIGEYVTNGALIEAVNRIGYTWKRASPGNPNAVFKMKVIETSNRTTRPTVYLLKCGPYYKIGVSQNVEKRMKQLGTQPPFDIELAHTCAYDPDPYALEKDLHGLYAPKRKNGEWFELDDSDVEYIKGL